MYILHTQSHVVIVKQFLSRVDLRIWKKEGCDQAHRDIFSWPCCITYSLAWVWGHAPPWKIFDFRHSKIATSAILEWNSAAKPRNIVEDLKEIWSRKYWTCSYGPVVRMVFVWPWLWWQKAQIIIGIYSSSYFERLPSNLIICLPKEVVCH